MSILKPVYSYYNVPRNRYLTMLLQLGVTNQIFCIFYFICFAKTYFFWKALILKLTYIYYYVLRMSYLNALAQLEVEYFSEITRIRNFLIHCPCCWNCWAFQQKEFAILLVIQQTLWEVVNIHNALLLLNRLKQLNSSSHPKNTSWLQKKYLKLTEPS